MSFKKDDEAGDTSLYAHIDRSSVLQEARVFNETPINPRKCRATLTKILYLIYQSERLQTKEATETFFSITKLFQSQDIPLRQTVYLLIKELSTVAEDVIMVTASLSKDLTAKSEISKANAIRALCKITDASMIQGIERFLKQAIVDKNHAISSAALVSALHLFTASSKDVVRRWANEVQDSVNSKGGITQYHALGLLYQIRQHDRMAIIKLVQTLARGSLRSPFAYCMLVRYTAKIIDEDESVETSFDGIYIGGKNGVQVGGRVKFVKGGVGFQETVSKRVHTMRGQDIRRAWWQRCAREFELRIELSSGQVHKFDGFPRDTFEAVADALQQYCEVELEAKETHLRGYNWGKTALTGPYLQFSVGGRAAFEVPLADVANTAPLGKNDVSIEFAQSDAAAAAAAGAPAGARAADALVEMHFYVPGMAVQSQLDGDGDGNGNASAARASRPAARTNADADADAALEPGQIDEAPVFGDDGEALTAAALFCDTIKMRADVGQAQGESLVSFDDLLCLTPRGRFEVDMFASFFRIRGKSNDYRILFSSIKRLFLLPKPDDLHTMFVIQLDPPLRQGQTRYPFLVFQFDRDEEVDAVIKLDEETLASQYNGRLRKDYDGPIFLVVSEIFKGLANVNIISPGLSYKSTQGYSGVKCALKANEAFLYPLEKSFVSVPKPATLIPHADVTSVTFSRVNSSTSNTKTIEMKISTTGGDFAFTSISREEYQGLAAYCRNKKLRVTNELGDGQGGGGYDGIMDSDEEGGDGDKKRKRIANMKDPLGGDLNDDSESDDEDFEDKGSGSDVDLEYDSDAGSDSSDDDASKSGSGSDDNASEDEGESKGKVEKKKSSSHDESGNSSKKIKSSSSSSTQQTKTKNSEGGQDKKKVKKDPNAPKGPQSSYIIFSNAVRNSVREEDSSLSMTDVSKKIGILWKDLSADEKKKYEDLAAIDKNRYKKEMAVYEKNGGALGSSSAATAPKKSSPSESKDKDAKSAEYVDEDD
ncbi:FACT complex subunit [Physocladia obscura]|uniref:FACT complex subunit n=1 Tax=Physocladia obscura TaxID=109957 RepID=A0AAD5SUC5_9FUNG|nr:FACT complex subunit [Physocladia obscura]